VLCTCINNLGNSWQRRYLVTSALNDIDTAIRTWPKAVDTSPSDHSERPMFVQNLAFGLRHRYSATGRIGVSFRQGCMISERWSGNVGAPRSG
jgi:hypothetical protein